MIYKKISGAIIALLLTLCTAGYAQSSDSSAGYLRFGAGGRYGHPFNGHGLYDRLAKVHGWGGAEISAEFQTTPRGTSWWDAAYGYPSLGLSLDWENAGTMSFKQLGGFGDFVDLGANLAFSIYRGEFFSFGPVLTVGAAWSSRQFKMVSNPYLLEIGSPVVALLGAGLDFRFRVAPRWEIVAGVNLRHHSNGMIRVPNWGLNQLGGNLGVRFSPAEESLRRSGPSPEKPDYPRGIHAYVRLGAGVHSCDTERAALEKDVADGKIPASDDLTVPARARMTLSVEASWRYAPLFSSGIGVQGDWCPNDYRNTDLTLTGKEDARGYSPFMAGIYLAQDFHYKNFSAHLHYGVYLFKRSGLSEDLATTFQRVGARYRIPYAGGLTVGFDMRAHYWDRSYCLETSVGYIF
ncbi:MAG: acyloxyacyl hydrolase [Bacteroidales bacterium]|nr:acyloxyacyl hydrolase [Bacteroidales bacterium]